MQILEWLEFDVDLTPVPALLSMGWPELSVE